MIKKFVHNARNRQSKKVDTLATKTLVLSDEYWVKIIQLEHIPVNYSELTQAQPVPLNSVTRPFNPISSEREIILLDCGLQKDDISYKEAHPVLLPT